MGRHKRKSTRKSSCCSVCENSYQISTSIILPCSAHIVSPPHTLCDSCLYRHIFTVLSRDITSSVICPIQGCDAMIPNDIIQPILVKFNPNLLAEYTLKSGWHGTSKQWIKRFAARCPKCSVPIEKNGGCNQVVCQRCHQVFDWQRAKDSNLYRMQNRYKMNSFGFGGGLPQQFSGPFPQQGFGQLGSGGGFFNSGPQFPGGNAFSGGSPFPGGMPFSGGSPFQGVNAFPGGNPFSSPLPPSGFPSGPIGSPFGQGFGFPAGSGGFGYQPQPFGSPFFPGQQPPFANQNYFGSGSYGQPRSRHSSRRSSKSRRRRTSSSSTSSDENSGRGSPFFNPGNPYVNLQPFPNMPPVPPRVASPLIPPQRPIW